MPRTLTLHIGTMKTGSTTIQQLLAYNREALRERGICYPRTVGMNNHSLLAFKFATAGLPGSDGDSRAWGDRSLIEAMEDVCEDMGRELSELPPTVDRIIISGEIFSNHIRDPEDVGRLRDFLSPYVDKIEVLIYLRRQDSHVASNYTQTLRRGVLKRPTLFARKNRQQGFTYYYDQLLQPWADVFGDAAIKPRIFERDTNKSWDVVADFIQATGCGPLPQPARAFRQNPSMNAAGQRAIREIGWILKGDDETQEFARTKLWRRLTFETTNALQGRGWLPTQAEAREFNARFAESNEEVRRRWLPERASLFSDDYGHLPEKAAVVDADGDLRAVTAVLIHVVKETLEQEEKDRKRARRTLAVKVALRQDKNDPEARLELARLMFEEERLDAAREIVERLLRQAPDHAGARALVREIEAAEPEMAEADI